MTLPAIPANRSRADRPAERGAAAVEVVANPGSIGDPRPSALPVGLTAGRDWMVVFAAVPIPVVARAIWPGLLAALAIALGIGVAVAGPDPSKVDPDLMALYGQHVTHLGQKSAEPFVAGDPRVRVVADRVVVDAVADGDVRVLESELSGLGMRGIAVFGRVVSGELPLDAIPSLETAKSLRFARPARAGRRIGSVTSQGDVAMRADFARAAFGVTGAGVQVGVLSDSFDCLHGAATDVTAGNL